MPLLYKGVLPRAPVLRLEVEADPESSNKDSGGSARFKHLQMRHEFKSSLFKRASLDTTENW